MEKEKNIFMFQLLTYKRVGDICLLTFCNIDIYKRVGKAVSIFGLVFGNNKVK